MAFSLLHDIIIIAVTYDGDNETGNLWHVVEISLIIEDDIKDVIMI